ncbi:MAG: glycine cleavage system protein [Sphingomonas bacterium]|nr:glycine cleavage system protein [Sphingomonas bacterium]
MRLYFTKEHDWIAVDDDIATIGITDVAQAQIGEVLFVDLPAPGKVLEKGAEAVLIEATKAVSDLLSPLTGVVIDANAALRTRPSLVNIAAEGEGWLFRMSVADRGELTGLLDAAGYRRWTDRR